MIENTILKYFWQKLLLTIPVGVFALSQQHYIIIWGLALVVIIDTILGLWVSIKHKIFASYKLGRIASKISKYSLAMMSIWVVATVEPTLLGWTFQGLGVFLILTEVFSNFEKLAILGMEVPTKLLAKVNRDFDSYYFGDSKKRKQALKKILNKKQADC